MSKEHIVNLDNISLLKEFINEVTYHIKSDVDAIYDRQVVDAKSLLGVMSIAIHPLRVWQRCFTSIYTFTWKRTQYFEIN